MLIGELWALPSMLRFVRSLKICGALPCASAARTRCAGAAMWPMVLAAKDGEDRADMLAGLPPMRRT